MKCDLDPPVEGDLDTHHLLDPKLADGRILDSHETVVDEDCPGGGSVFAPISKLQLLTHTRKTFNKGEEAPWILYFIIQFNTSKVKTFVLGL